MTQGTAKENPHDGHGRIAIALSRHHQLTNRTSPCQTAAKPDESQGEGRPENVNMSRRLPLKRDDTLAGGKCDRGIANHHRQSCPQHAAILLEDLTCCGDRTETGGREQCPSTESQPQGQLPVCMCGSSRFTWPRARQESLCPQNAGPQYQQWPQKSDRSRSHFCLADVVTPFFEP